jgi:hypothetical protein
VLQDLAAGVVGEPHFGNSDRVVHANALLGLSQFDEGGPDGAKRFSDWVEPADVLECPGAGEGQRVRANVAKSAAGGLVSSYFADDRRRPARIQRAHGAIALTSNGARQDAGLFPKDQRHLVNVNTLVAQIVEHFVACQQLVKRWGGCAIGE